MITLITGPMRSGKTTIANGLMDVNWRFLKYEVEPNGKIDSLLKGFERMHTHYIDIRTILVSEAQFLSKDDLNKLILFSNDHSGRHWVVEGLDHWHNQEQTDLLGLANRIDFHIKTTGICKVCGKHQGRWSMKTNPDKRGELINLDRNEYIAPICTACYDAACRGLLTGFELECGGVI